MNVDTGQWEAIRAGVEANREQIGELRRQIGERDRVVESLLAHLGGTRTPEPPARHARPHPHLRLVSRAGAR